jgi:transposase
MKGQKYHISLTEIERKKLKELTMKGRHPSRQITRARVLLALNGGKKEQKEIAELCQCSVGLVYDVSRGYAAEGVEGVLTRKNSGKPSHIKADGEVEAKLIKLACGPAPKGYAKWTLRLLEANSKVELGVQLSDTTIRNVLKKNAVEAVAKERILHREERRR